jgi:hypothetical protein
MQEALYVNAEDISSGNYKKPSLRPENLPHLLPEQLAQISTAFIQQLLRFKLKSREIRIVSAIYSQTISHGRRENDMSGGCLRVLTGIRNDHANAAVRHLAKLHIIMIREANDHRHWMSINFEFNGWGDEDFTGASNNPKLLLSKEYQAETHARK